jgi:hypothetical protein
VGDNDGAIGPGEIDILRAARRVGGVDTHPEAVGGILTGRRVGRFTRGHGHDLHAHDHEAVVEDRAHHDQQKRQNEGKLHERLALASAPHHPQALEIRDGFHGAFSYPPEELVVSCSSASS